MSDSEVRDHISRYLGAFRDIRPVEAGFGVSVHETPSMVSAVTDGLRSRTLQSPLPLELACSVRPDQETYASELVERFAMLALAGDAELEYDDGILTEEPLVPGTEIHGLLAAPHPYADEMFNLFRGGDGELSLQFVTLVPVTSPEGRYLRDHETGDLFDLWKSTATDLLDLHRRSAV